MRKVKIATTQMYCSEDRDENLKKAEALVRKAAEAGAQIILLQELFETLYFCQEEDPKYFELAMPVMENPAVKRFMEVAKELEVVIPVPFFERSGKTYFNSVAIIDADGSLLGVYRKSHIPYGGNYMEKFYFSPGDTGFQVYKTKYAIIGVGICWDQWFPETGRLFALHGAELLFYPTANGDDTTEFNDPLGKYHWKNTMMGQAVANTIPVITANRIGDETVGGTTIHFFGYSFIMDTNGELIVSGDDETEGFLMAEFDLDEIKKNRDAWCLYRDRRPDLYEPMLTLDGEHKVASVIK